LLSVIVSARQLAVLGAAAAQMSSDGPLNVACSTKPRGRSSRVSSRHVGCCVLVASLVVGLMGEAQAISLAKLLRAEVMISDARSPSGWRNVGRFGGLVDRFRKAGHECVVSTYEYGGALTCRTRAGRLTREGQQVIVDLQTAGRFNETELECEIRPDGVNSQVLQGPEALELLNALAPPRRISP
jgi:hypothetical protein